MSSGELGSFHHQSPARNRDSWRSKNYQEVPGYTDFNEQSRLLKLGLIPRYRICPHYPLIKICAELVGIEPHQLATTGEFCGIQKEYEDTMSFLSGFRGTKSHPYSLCSIIHDQLQDLITFIQDERKPQTASISEVLNSNTDLRTKKQVLDHHIETLDDNSKRDGIFLRWQEVIFNNCCIPGINNNINAAPDNKPVPLSEIEDLHFRRISSPQDLSYEEVISRVSSFLTSLRDQVTGDINEHSSEVLKSRFLTGALHCTQAPEYHEFGMRS